MPPLSNLISSSGSALTIPGSPDQSLSGSGIPSLFTTTGTTSSVLAGAGTTYSPYYCSKTGDYDEITLRLTTLATSANVAFGIYDADPSSGEPNNLLGQQTGIDITTTIGPITATLSPAVSLTAGAWYYIAIAINTLTGTPRFRGFGSATSPLSDKGLGGTIITGNVASVSPNASFFNNSGTIPLPNPAPSPSSANDSYFIAALRLVP